ncbi:MAG: sarcosine oxidase subunit gamma [Pseudomonadota bacterium]
MIDLVANASGAGLLPLGIGSARLQELDVGPITSIAPFNGQSKATDAALSKSFGLGLPEPGKSTSAVGLSLIWTGRGQYFLIGAHPGDLPAAVTDQSDAWTIVSLTGGTDTQILARLCPIDTSAMEVGDVARSLIGHMSAVIWRRENGFTILVFRAFAQTLIHEFEGVMTSLAAQAEIEP